MKIITKILLLFCTLSIFSCCALKPLDAEEEKLARTKAAQERLNNSNQNANSITKDLD